MWRRISTSGFRSTAQANGDGDESNGGDEDDDGGDDDDGEDDDDGGGDDDDEDTDGYKKWRRKNKRTKFVGSGDGGGGGVGLGCLRWAEEKRLHCNMFLSCRANFVLSPCWRGHKN